MHTCGRHISAEPCFIIVIMIVIVMINLKISTKCQSQNELLNETEKKHKSRWNK